MDPSVLSEVELELELELEKSIDRKHIHVRKREVDATESERFQLYAYSQIHPQATQLELSRWFHATFKKEINQSTVSRMLKRYRDNPPPPEVIEVSLQSNSRIKRSR